MITTLPAPPAFRGTFAQEGPAVRDASGASGPFRIEPVAVAGPTDADDVVRLVEWARAEGVPLVPRGAGTGMPGGNVGRGVSVDLTALRRITEVPGRDDAVWVGAGVVAADLDDWAERRGRFLPALPSSADRCTLGGMVANNAAGARSFGYGAVRDHVEAVEIVLADATRTVLEPGGRAPDAFRALHAGLSPLAGTLAASWPRVRKNSSGYALDRFLPAGEAHRLLVGSEGTLGIVTAVRVRLSPTPPDRRVLLLPVPSLRDLPDAATAAGAAGAAACEFLGPRFLDVAGLRDRPELGLAGVDAALLVELDGRVLPPADGIALLETAARDLGVSCVEARESEARRRLWSVRHGASPAVAAAAGRGLVSMQFIEDSVVPPDALARYLSGLQDILESEGTDAVTFGHAGDGNVHVNPLIDVTRTDWKQRVERILRSTADLVATLGGTLAGEHGDGRLRAPLAPIVWAPEAVAAFARVKRALDPVGLFNPGVVVPLPGQHPLEGLSAEGGRR